MYACIPLIASVLLSTHILIIYDCNRHGVQVFLFCMHYQEMSKGEGINEIITKVTVRMLNYHCVFTPIREREFPREIPSPQDSQHSL